MSKIRPLHYHCLLQTETVWNSIRRMSTGWRGSNGERQNLYLSSPDTNFPYQDHLDQLNLTSLADRRSRGDMVKVYKLVHGHDRVNAGDEFLKLETITNRDRTRRHALRLKKPRHRLHRRNQFFSSRIVDQWNKLSQHVVMSLNINTLKNRYDRHMKMRRGSTPWASAPMSVAPYASFLSTMVSNYGEQYLSQQESISSSV